MASRREPPPIKLTLAGYIELFGYTALRTSLARIDSELAVEYRSALAGEGWIA